MNICLEFRNDDLDELTDSEFTELLNHADNCQYHADRLEVCEAEIIPLLNLAYVGTVLAEAKLNGTVSGTKNLSEKSLGIISSVEKFGRSIIHETKNLFKLEKNLFNNYLYQRIKNYSAVLLIGITILFEVLLISALYKTNKSANSDLLTVRDLYSATSERIQQQQWHPGYYRGNIPY